MAACLGRLIIRIGRVPEPRPEGPLYSDDEYISRHPDRGLPSLVVLLLFVGIGGRLDESGS